MSKVNLSEETIRDAQEMVSSILGMVTDVDSKLMDAVGPSAGKRRGMKGKGKGKGRAQEKEKEKDNGKKEKGKEDANIKENVQWGKSGRAKKVDKTSLVSLPSPLVKPEKGKAKVKEMTPAKPVMPHLDNDANKTLPATRAHGRLMKEDSRNAGWMPEETLVKVLMATVDEAVRESFSAKHCMTCIAKAAALPSAPLEQLFLPDTPEPKPVEETAEKPADKKKQKPVHSYAPAKPKKHEQEDDKDLVGPLQNQSCLPEAKVKLPVMPLHMAEHKMLKLQKSLHTAQKAVDAAQKAMDTVTSWADQVQTLLGRALAE
ncbi:hypothetical protein DACRYDRAFT_104477 [Dacryopinax primogenitus]|uniref:Uncharacterized protein n=1 Tax=Dacryopinax primogenitus (strain DJM 731) TaxID=1858805 RepID=M5G8T7_DACPD|nr:uncharacterized protein DACRYDRAFT_104477 [Dacryopinax primogenitus]EJU04595.1 hypothetical protein DACRYDRAFT_104477 [Dacryopinax primogenitus]